MKILHISKFYPPYRGGIEDICHSFVNILSDIAEQKVICFNDKAESVIADFEGVEIIRCGSLFNLSSQPVSFSLYKYLRTCIKDFNPDIIHLHLPNPLACLYLLNILPTKAKLVLHWHSDIIAQKILYKIIKSIEKSILNRADKIIVTSPTYVDASYPLQNHKDKIVVIPNMISSNKMSYNKNTIEFINSIKKEYGDNVIFFMGRHVPYKGIEYLIEAEQYIKEDCTLLIAGTGPLTPKLKKLAKSKRIKFIGKIPDEQVNAYMYAAKIFAFPSITKNEAFGIALTEAMYCEAVPVTFSIIGSGVNWVTIKDVTGLEVENRNSKAFGHAIDTLLKNDDLRLKLSLNAKMRVDTMFTLPVIQKQLLAFYKELS